MAMADTISPRAQSNAYTTISDFNPMDPGLLYILFKILLILLSVQLIPLRILEISREASQVHRPLLQAVSKIQRGKT